MLNKIFLFILVFNLAGCAAFKKATSGRKNKSKTTKTKKPTTTSMTVNLTNINFGDVEIGSRKLDEISIKNNTKKPMSINIADSCFKAIRVNQSFCISIKPRATCRIEVEFQPNDKEFFVCSVGITNQTGESHTVEISGKGIK